MMYAFLYRLATGAYFIAVRIAALFKPKAALFVSGRKDIIAVINKALSGEQRKRVWIHCASLGEFEQGRPVLEAIKEQYPRYAIILTFFSPSGYEVRKDYVGADYIFYLPVDTPANAAAFMDIVQPAVCLFIKYELWYFYLSQIAKRGIPALLVSAVFRKDHGFFKWYGGLQRRMLASFEHIFVQDADSMALLKGIGINNVSVSGDTRFDRVIRAAEHAATLAIADEFCAGYKIIVAGSTWKEDETMLHKAMELLSDQWRMILVPHEIDESHLREIEKLYGNNMVRWSQWNSNTDKRVLLVDKVGLLMQLYKYSRVAWIGGGFGKDGVHNVLEAAVYGVPVFYGHIYHQFIEAEELVKTEGAIVANTATSLICSLDLMENKSKYQFHADAAKQYVAAHGGATKKILMYIFKFFN